LKNLNTVVLFGKGTYLLVLQSNEQDHDFISVFEVKTGIEKDRISIKKFSGYGYSKNWLFYIPYRKKEQTDKEFKDRLIIMELIDHNKVGYEKYKYDNFL